MSLFEYEARMYAYRLKRLDKEHDMHFEAWLKRMVEATKGNGKPKFTSFESFFDYDKQLKKIESGFVSEIKPQHKRLANIAAGVNARGG